MQTHDLPAPLINDILRALRSHGENARADMLEQACQPPAVPLSATSTAVGIAAAAMEQSGIEVQEEKEDIESLKARVVKAQERSYADRIEGLEVRDKNNYELIEAHDGMIHGLCNHLGIAYPPTRAQARTSTDPIVPPAADAPKAEQVYPLFWLKREESGDIWLIITPQGGRQAMMNLGQSHGPIIAGAIEDAMKAQAKVPG